MVAKAGAKIGKKSLFVQVTGIVTSAHINTGHIWKGLGFILAPEQLSDQGNIAQGWFDAW